jgi:hypothetical protein
MGVCVATLETFGASIVAIGAFNPPLLSVDWFVANKLVGPGDADFARSRSDYLVTRQISRFQTEFAILQVTESQLSVSSSGGPATPALADLAIGIFELLPHTPATAVGLNFMGHFKMPNLTDYHQVGDSLAPKEVWRNIFPDENPGLQTLVMRMQQGRRDGTILNKNEKNVTVQPSSKVQQGVFLQINHHFVVNEENVGLANSADAARVVRGNWTPCHDQAVPLFERILASSVVAPREV